MQDSSPASVAARPAELSTSPPTAATTTFDRDSLGRVCALVRLSALSSGVSLRDVDDLLIAVSEVVTNVICHAGGVGSLALECQSGGLLVEIRDSGAGLPDNVLLALLSFDGAQLGGLRRARLLCKEFDVSSSAQGVTVRIFTPNQDAK